MSKIKLTKEQKEYLKSIESKKKRKKLKENFLFENIIKDADNVLKEFKICSVGFKTQNPFLTSDKLREITEPKTSDSEFKRFSLKDLRDAFTMARLMKEGQKVNQSDYEAVYYYNEFNDFLKDL